MNAFIENALRAGKTTRHKRFMVLCQSIEHLRDVVRNFAGAFDLPELESTHKDIGKKIQEFRETFPK